ncbi:integrin beta-7 isoform X2 [Hypomesus transpacificus]|uniref:integrin beta-7 isoform X2 n=1 Tax=Hypomesus transpacificus TaxID=137520 RepID=UPI001F07348B|nr:integrin beta-7 isoform X2 [Hypomesus transpacificus]
MPLYTCLMSFSCTTCLLPCQDMINIFFLTIILLHSVGPGVHGCVPQQNCSECMKSPGCAWCKHKDFLKAGESSERRCDTAQSLITRGCEKVDLMNPLPDYTHLKNQKLSSDMDTVVQLSPQNLHVKLRIGVPIEFNVSFKRAEGYPIDLYYLMDLSFSMKDDLNMIKNLGEDILKTLRKNTKHVRIGFGSFVDKVALPYVSQLKAKKKDPCPSRLDICQPAFSFQNILALTRDAAEFKRMVSKQSISGNLDSPEAGFDAIMQAAVCQDVIGWANVTRILVYTSDDTFHFAGDGSLAGIFEPHDGRCHLNGSGFYDGTKYDYPSVGHLARVLSSNNIQLIFAVTEDSVSAYHALSKLIPQSVVGVLSNDSSNVVQLISEAYRNLSSTILLEHQGTPSGLEVTYKSKCASANSSPSWQKRGECMNVKINEQVDFTVRLTSNHCLNGNKEFYLKVQGISETVKVSVETLCDCDCGDKEIDSQHCHYNGTLSCGACSCKEGHLGQKCECMQPKDDDVSCYQNNSTQLCSGHGICVCGKCVCQGNYRGEFCDCDDSSCARHDNKLCGGNGVCECGKCNCTTTFEGSACQCSTKKDQCMSDDSLLCSGQGTCQCNKCNCNKDFIGEKCSMIPTACQKFKECMTCILEKDKDNHKSCNTSCGSVTPTKSQGPEQYVCVTESISYKVELLNGNIVILYTDLPSTIDKTLVIIGSSVSSIIFIGIAVILVSRLLLELHYRREYSSFLKAQEETDWKDTHNPLFQDATTTIMNPLHIQDG